MPAVMEIDVETKEWSGKLPSHCKNVCVQWLDEDEIWRPTGPKAPRPKFKTIALIEKFMQTGPLKYKKYRLIPATGDHGGESNDEEVAMATKEKKEKKAKKEEVELVAGRFRPDSLLAKMYELLKDGKARTPDEIAKVVKPKSVANITKGRFRQLRKWGNRSEMYSAVITDEGKVQLLPFGKEPKEKKAEKKAETKKEAPAKKETKKAESKKANGKGKKEAKKKESAAPATKPKSGPSVEA